VLQERFTGLGVSERFNDNTRIGRINNRKKNNYKQTAMNQCIKMKQISNRKTKKHKQYNNKLPNLIKESHTAVQTSMTPSSVRTLIGNSTMSLSVVIFSMRVLFSSLKAFGSIKSVLVITTSAGL
jgi:superoxide dismutase